MRGGDAPGRRIRLGFVAFILLAAGLTGCLSDGGTDAGPQQDGPKAPPANQTPSEPRAIELTLSPCNAIEAFATADAATAREHVPDDFDLMLSESGQAQVILGGLRCGENAAGAERGFLAIFVEPQDDDLTAEGIGNYFWEPEHRLVDGNEATLAFRQLGANAAPATSVNLTLGTAETTLEIEMENGTHRASSPAPTAPGLGQAAGTAPSFREYSAAEGGYAYIEAAFESGAPEDRGTGQPMQVTTAEGTVARELLGAEAMLPTLAFEGFTYADATVGFVPREAC